MRNNNTEFLDVFSKAQDFMKKRNLPFDFESSRLQTLQSKKESFKISVFYAALDLIIMQFSERFNDESIKFLSQTSFFTPKGMAEKAIVKDDIKDICEFYQLNTSQVFEEMLMFRNIYKMAKTGDVIITRDLEVKEDLSDSENSSSDDDNNFEMNDYDWRNYSFILPYRLLINFSAFPNLTILYKYLLTILTTSCTAERVMTKRFLKKFPKKLVCRNYQLIAKIDATGSAKRYGGGRLHTARTMENVDSVKKLNKTRRPRSYAAKMFLKKQAQDLTDANNCESNTQTTSTKIHSEISSFHMVHSTD
ncbi:uncharacterized protein LOC135926792 [Gordionus sp. m RMFG-2023]|uniref:uncharacterized protein LOC135926792 n=1 Tax=Gordionus sp. m RMFG-2023 TaxID=3053472 RepID=UPI0031FCF889